MTEIGDSDLGAVPAALTGDAAALARGVGRLLHHMGFASLEEFVLTSGRRADLFALGPKGEVAIVEIKVSVADFRGDAKWPEYRRHCDRLYFAVPSAFPREVIPPDTGLIVADRYGAVVMREPPEERMATALRHRETRRFAIYAANRLRRQTDADFFAQR